MANITVTDIKNIDQSDLIKDMARTVSDHDEVMKDLSVQIQKVTNDLKYQHRQELEKKDKQITQLQNEISDININEIRNKEIEEREKDEKDQIRAILNTILGTLESMNSRSNNFKRPALKYLAFVDRLCIFLDIINGFTPSYSSYFNLDTDLIDRMNNLIKDINGEASSMVEWIQEQDSINGPYELSKRN